MPQKNQVEVTDDYTSQGPKLVMNAAAESQTKVVMSIPAYCFNMLIRAQQL